MASPSSRLAAEPAKIKAIPISPRTAHLNDDALGLHILGDLPVYRRAYVEAHLAKCDVCQDRLEYMLTVIEAFTTEPPPPPPQRQRLVGSAKKHNGLFLVEARG
jgi:hypothetical protein